ncbi:MAG: trimeric intracellular cation channel family protein [Candidatus Phlomobacter fragariae]
MLLSILYIIGITAEAIAGALAAGRRKMDVFGVIIIASATAIGGCSVRDILLVHYPLSWVKYPEYIVIVASAAVITIWLAPMMKHLRRLFLIFDVIGLIVFSIIGVQITLNMNYSYIIAAVVTGVFGGVLRDMLCNTIPLVFQKEIYAGVSFAAAWIYIGLLYTPLPKDIVIIITLIAGLTPRLLAIRYRLGLPVFNYEHND